MMSDATPHLFAGRRTLMLSMAEVKQLLPMEECIRLQEIAFADHARGGGMNSPSSWLRVNKHRGWMKLLAGFVDETDAMGIKVLARYPNNPPGMNLGSLIVLFDATNGFPLAIFDGVYITAARTGAGAGIATARCARPDSRVIGVLGTGVVARFSLLAVCACQPNLREVYVYSRDAERRAAFAQEMARATGAQVTAVDAPRKAVAEADVIITATNSPQPSLFTDWVRPGTHINAMGIKQEIEPALFRTARTFGDARETAIEDGKFGVAVQAGAVTADAIAGEIGDVLIGRQPARTSEDEITIFDSSGLAVQDIVCAHYVYQSALARQMGVYVDLGLADEP
jgi:alanine dehydrogenase